MPRKDAKVPGGGGKGEAGENPARPRHCERRCESKRRSQETCLCGQHPNCACEDRPVWHGACICRLRSFFRMPSCRFS